MYPDYHLPKPLRAAEFYLLLALAKQDSHAYPLKGLIQNVSLGSVKLDDTQLRRLIIKLGDEAFIEPAGSKPAGKSGRPRLHYALTEHGKLRLQAEIQRLAHALAVAKATAK